VALKANNMISKIIGKLLKIPVFNKDLPETTYLGLEWIKAFM